MNKEEIIKSSTKLILNQLKTKALNNKSVF
jgi:hypothetical protein